MAGQPTHHGLRVPGVALIALAILGPSPAPAQSEREVRLLYQRKPGAETCPDERAVRDAVAGRLGYDPFREAAERTVRATVERLPRAFAGEVVLQGADGQPHGRRRITGNYTHCEQLISALALTISIAIDPLGAARPLPSAPPAAPLLPPPSLAPAPVVSAPSADLEASAGGLAYFAAFPRTAFGLGMGLRSSWGHFLLGLEAQASFKAILDVPGGRVETSRYGAALTSCLREGWLSGCGLISGAVFRAAGLGLAPSRATAAPYVALGVQGELQLPLAGPIAARLSAGLEVPLIQAAVMVSGAQVWKSPTVAGIAGTALVWRF